MKNISYDNEQAIKDLFLGHKIVSAREINKEVGSRYYSQSVTAELVLDDGTTIYVAPNEGCGGCNNGWFDVTELNEVDNIITRVDVIEDNDSYEGFASSSLQSTRKSMHSW